MSSDRVVAIDVWTAALTTDPLDAADVIVGDPSVASAELATVGGVDVGIWQITEGEVTDVEVDEVFVVLSGRGQVQLADGTVIALTPGVAVRLEAGERTVWTIHETLRKIYVLSPGPDARPHP